MEGLAGEHHHCYDKSDEKDDDEGDIDQQTVRSSSMVLQIHLAKIQQKQEFLQQVLPQVTSRNTNKSKSGSEILYHVKIRQSVSFLFTCELKIGH